MFSTNRAFHFLNTYKHRPTLAKEKPKWGGIIMKEKMKGISDYKLSSNCSTVTIALPSAAKVMPSADCGV